MKCAKRNGTDMVYPQYSRTAKTLKMKNKRNMQPSTEHKASETLPVPKLRHLLASN